MEKRYLQYSKGVYYADIDISVAEWKTMLKDKRVFNESSLQMIQYWYEQLDYQATSKEIMIRYQILTKGTPFNGIVIGLGKRIIQHLNRFEIIGTDGNKSYFIIPFEGWHEDFDPNKNFVWKLREELVIAIQELQLFEPNLAHDMNELETPYIPISTPEGKKIGSYSTKYERNQKNRRLAIKIHGTKCHICGFDFEKIYGERGRGFIEVHHIKPLYENQEETEIDPKTDLICVCSNCHKMFHRKKDNVPTPEELKKIVSRSK